MIINKLPITLSLILLLLLRHTLIASTKSDSIRTQIELATSTEGIGHLYYQLAYAELFEDSEKALATSKKTEQLAKELDDKRLMAKTYYLQGYIYALKDDVENATRYYLAAKNIYRVLNDQEKQQDLLQNVGTMAMNNESFEVAELLYSDRLEFIEKINDFRIEADMYFDLGVIYQKQSKYVLALRNFLITKSIFDKKAVTEDTVKFAQILNELGIVNMLLSTKLSQKEKFADSALYYYKKALAMDGSAVNQMKVYNNIGNLKLANEDFELASDYLHKALVLNKMVNSPRVFIYIQNNLGKMHYQQGQYDSAYYYFSLAVKSNTSQKSFQQNLKERSIDIDFHGTVEMERSLAYLDSIAAVRLDLLPPNQEEISRYFQRQLQNQKAFTQINANYVQKEVAVYYKKENQRLKNEAKNKLLLLVGGLSIGFILLILVFLWLYIKLFKKTKKYADYIRKVNKVLKKY